MLRGGALDTEGNRAIRMQIGWPDSTPGISKAVAKDETNEKVGQGGASSTEVTTPGAHVCQTQRRPTKRAPNLIERGKLSRKFHV